MPPPGPPPGPPKLPADLAGNRRPEPPSSSAAKRREDEGPQAPQLSVLLTAAQRLEQAAQGNSTSLGGLLAVTQRLEQSALSNTAGLQELLTELQKLRGQLKDQQGRELAVPPPLLAPPPPRAAGGGLAAVAALVAAIAALGALAGAALLIREQKRQLTSQLEVTASIGALRQAVTQLGEATASQAPAADHAGAAKAPGPDSTARPADPAEGKAVACPAASESKPRVLLPNLVGLRLVEARTTVAPLQLQLLPTDKRLKEASKIGWQLPNPGAELEPDEAVTVSLKPPVQKKKKK